MRWMAAFSLFIAQESAPPAIVSVASHAEPTKILVVFDKPLDQATAEASANYSVDHGVKVEAASKGLDLRTVTLTTSPLAEGVVYTLSVKNVRDCAVPPASVAAGTFKTFSFTKGLFGTARASDGGV